MSHLEPVSVFLVLSWILCVAEGNLLDIWAFRALCNEDRGWTFYRSDPWNCNRYFACIGGVTVSGKCPPGEVFSDTTYRCHLPYGTEVQRCKNSVFASLETACPGNRLAKSPSPFSCAQFFDCSASTSRPVGDTTPATPLQLMECPYPSLYNAFTRRCQRFDQVACQNRPVPKAPCHYLQYQQLCKGPACLPCAERHPSCVGLSNGAHPLAKYKTLFILCYRDRTLDVRKCKHDLNFSITDKKCVKPA